MFKKKPNIKPLAPLRSSDRRRTADQIIKDLALPLPSEDAAASPEDKAAAAQARIDLRNALLPDNALSARFTTTHGPDLKQVSGTVYVGSHGGDSDDQRVLWVSIEGVLYPTVYTLWKNPGIVPLLHCGSNVVEERLKGGADLMIPGLINGPPYPSRAKKGAVVAIAGHTKPSVPMVVGTCAVDVSELKESRKGVAVETMHWQGDEIWAWSASGKPGVEPPDQIAGWFEGDGSIDEVTERTRDLELEYDEDGGGVALPSSAAVPDDATVEDESEEQAEEPERDLTTAEIDAAFLNAFLYGINSFKSANPNSKNFNLPFPLSQTFVLSSLINPFLPTFTPHRASQLVIKKTSWKTIKKFIKHLDKQHIVKSKDQQGNEAVILDVDFEHDAVLSFKPYRLPKKESVGGQSQAGREPDTGGDTSIGQRLTVSLFYKPKEKITELFASNTAKTFYTKSEIRSSVEAYIEGQELVSPANKRLVKLNPFLANSVFDGSKGSLDKEVLANGSVTRDMLTERVLASCATFHVIARNDASPTSLKPKAGAPPKIQIVLETRSGNKMVTKVSGLEAYSIAPQPLADELRKACAGSTSVEKLAGSSPKAPIMEVMVQGPQKDAVLKALERRGVNKAWVDVLDKTKGKKKG
ncbi:uncharacterized protein PV09_09518 [Verruconis gallopava]|uniref:SUI1 domain-containing protein n=1 Tax=Verruconis gallopava TaxID=253628 RepID=A0A0D1X9B4_9PEZI|nr:uncharacterized protein PV09_09518 [Verruconis gallopava]KIV98735.1 hypothetical protein PV09_09518 [Verruconis gallopava]